jgi:arsenite methyltransferase
MLLYMRQSVYEADVKAAIQQKYGEVARNVNSSTCCAGPCGDPISGHLYTADEIAEVPAKAVEASLGCGNPTALVALESGDVVLDLGSGGGIDVLLSAKRVGPTGKVYGLDTTDEMLALARENQRNANIANVEFLKGEIEHIPLPDQSVDVVISNCVINLAPDKAQVLREAFRVLKPGGRLAVSDVVVRGDVPPDVRKNVELWIGCVAGALEETEYRMKLSTAGFENIEIEPWRAYSLQDARDVLAAAGVGDAAMNQVSEGTFVSAFIRANRPARACCGPDCCS